MFRLFDQANYDFLSVRKSAYMISGAIAVLGLILLLFRGLNESIEFTGGTSIHVQAFSEEISSATIRSALSAAGIEQPEIQTFGGPNEFMIRARLNARGEVSAEAVQETGRVVQQTLEDSFGADNFEVVGVDAIGPKVGQELRTKALLAIIMSFGAVLIYLWFRFEWRSGVAAVFATVHDILLTVAFLSLINLEVSLVVVAGVLMVIGYSLNDTIITFDRVRENRKKHRKEDLYSILNRSINEVLPRTVLTSGTTLAATLALLVLAGPIVRSLAWVVTFGIVVGTFSSIYIASPVLMYIEDRWPGEETRGARTVQHRPARERTAT